MRMYSDMSETENMEVLMEVFADDTIFEEVASVEIDGDTTTAAQQDMFKALAIDHNENFAPPIPRLNQSATSKRFKSVSDQDLHALQDKRQSIFTKRSTKWGVKLFQEWSMETYGEVTDFNQINIRDLDARLGKFYAEATPKQNEKRNKQMSVEQAFEYNTNSYKSIRSALNRHIQDLGRDLDIVRGREFRSSNNILDGKLKQNLQQGLARTTKHKQIIPAPELSKISAYLNTENDPIALRFRIWFQLSIQFVSRGLEFHEQLKLDSFVFKTDENGHDYVALNHQTKQKNWQGGIDSADNPKEKRMYAVKSAGDACPVKSLLLFISKTSPNATSLFNRCHKQAIRSPLNEKLWYSEIPLKKYLFTRFMADIGKNAKCSDTYTAHCLRATAIQGMNDAGFEIRHIMHMSGHKNESSVRSYNRDCSTQQKKSMSDSIASLVVPVSTATASLALLPNTQDVHVQRANTQQVTATDNVPRNVALTSSNFMSSGFISNSSFNNCIFNFGHH